MPVRHSWYSSSELVSGQPACSTTIVRSPKSARAAAADLQQVGVRHELEDEVAFLEGAEDLGFGDTGFVGPWARTPRNRLGLAAI